MLLFYFLSCCLSFNVLISELVMAIEPSIQHILGDANSQSWYDVRVRGDTIFYGAPSASACHFYRESSLGAGDHTFSLARSGGSLFGYRVDFDGVIAVTSSYTQRKAFVFQELNLNAGDWEIVTELTTVGYPSDSFGRSVAVDDGTIVVGAPLGSDGSVTDGGYLYLFRESIKGNGDWNEVGTGLQHTSAVNSDRLGYAVAVSGVSIMGGSHYAAKVWVWTESSWGSLDWTEEILQPSDVPVSSEFGFRISMRNDVSIVGAQRVLDYKGAAYVYRKATAGASYTEEAILSPSDRDDVAGAFRFGSALGFDGVTVAIGAYSSNGGKGGMYLFQETTLTQGDWQEIAKLVHETALTSDAFGFSVGLDGVTAVLGAANGGNNAIAGQAVVFTANTCSSSPCMNGATCSTLGYNLPFTCTCPDGYFGATCSEDINECLSSPCMNGASCTDEGLLSYSCDCAAVGFTGENCVTDIDECASSPCENGGACLDVGMYAYLCLHCQDLGFTGPNCELDLDDCSSSPCVNDGTCTDLGANFYSCDCTDTGAYGYNCDTDIDECASSPCQNNGGCGDIGLHALTCNCAGTGFSGVFCENADMQDDCASSPCMHDGTCTDDGTFAYTCQCNEELYTGMQCELEVDYCASSPCDASAGECVSVLGGYSCLYDCISSPCLNNGLCIDHFPNPFQCDCSDTGFTGDTCHQDRDDCLSSPCLNTGRCIDTGINAFTCDCVNTGFQGDVCSLDIDDCLSSPCQNEAVCEDDGAHAFACNCTAGYDGLVCDQNINDCISHACLNGGTCIDGLSTYSCLCDDAHAGVFCQYTQVTTSLLDIECTEELGVDCTDTEAAEAAVEEWIIDVLLDTIGGTSEDYNVIVVPKVTSSDSTSLYDIMITYNDPDGEFINGGDEEFAATVEAEKLRIEQSYETSIHHSSAPAFLDKSKAFLHFFLLLLLGILQVVY